MYMQLSPGSTRLGIIPVAAASDAVKSAAGSVLNAITGNIFGPSREFLERHQIIDAFYLSRNKLAEVINSLPLNNPLRAEGRDYHEKHFQFIDENPKGMAYPDPGTTEQWQSLLDSVGQYAQLFDQKLQSQGSGSEYIAAGASGSSGIMPLLLLAGAFLIH